MKKLLYLLLFLTCLDPQDFLLGVSRGTTSGPAATTPCDLVSGCQAAYSVRRRVVAAYSGNLFQLSKSGSTLDIGQSGTNVDAAAIHTFCGSSNANSCKYHIFYDQSGNGNDLTCDKATVGGASSACTTFTDDVPLTWVGAWGSAPVPSVTFTSGTNFFSDTSLTGAPTGNVDKSVVMVANDTSYSSCCGLFGLAHVTNATPLVQGTDFLAMVRAGLNAGTPGYRLFGIDLELDVQELKYAPDDPTGYSTLAATQAMAAAGDFVGIITYQASGTTVTTDFNGEFVYVASYPTTITSDTNIRLGAGGDASRTVGVWYEGYIYSATLSGGNRATLQANAQSYYAITPFACSGSAPTTIISTLGQGSAVSASYGLRATNTVRRGPVAILRRASDGTFAAIGKTGCDFDTTTAATFCAATTCSIFQLYNQVLPAGHLQNYTVAINDNATLKNSTAATQPSYTASCATTSKPCMTFTSTQFLGTVNTQAFVQPYTVFAVARNTTVGTFGGVLTSHADFHPYLGRTSAANGGLFQADNGGGASTTGVTDSTWWGLAGEANDSTHVSFFKDGTQTGPTVATVTSNTIIMDIGASLLFTGNVAEIATILGSAVSAGNVSTIHTNMKSYWGY